MQVTKTDPTQIRVWIYRSIPKLTAEQENDIARRAGEFIAQWAAHGKKLDADFDILYGHYLVFFVDQTSAQNTGCSIDASVGFIREIEAKYNLGLLDRLQIGFLKDENVEFHHFNEIGKLVEEGVLSKEDKVINPMVQNRKEFEEGFIIPLSESKFL